jgi:hypothetical protein
MAGCASEHALTLVPRDGGPIGQGALPPAIWNSGDLSVRLDDQTYTGQWTYVPQGGGLMLMSGIAAGGGATAVGTGTGMMMPSGGNGLATLNGANGASLSCQFQYSDWSRTGVGLCQRDNGGIYDLHIK